MKMERLLDKYKDWDGENNAKENYIMPQTK